MRPAFRTLALLLVLALAGYAVIRPHLLDVVTPSIPPGLYFTWPSTTYHRGDVAATCLPAVAVDDARRDGATIASGTCPEGAAYALKIVVAVPGDRVVVGTDGIRVNGKPPLPLSAPLARTPRGDRLPRPKPFVVPAGTAVLWGPHPRSDDSRYWGALVPVLRAIPLLVKT